MTTSLATITVVGLFAVAVLGWLLIRARTKDHVDAILKKRAQVSKIANTALFVEGMEQLPVVLALGDDTLSYENDDLQANLELRLLDEVEYDDELSTGKSVHAGKVLRLRAHGQSFEFIVEKGVLPKWQELLPAGRMSSGVRQAV